MWVLRVRTDVLVNDIANDAVLYSDIRESCAWWGGTCRRLNPDAIAELVGVRGTGCYTQAV